MKSLSPTILIIDPLSPDSVALLQRLGRVVYLPQSTREQIFSLLPQTDVLIVRSGWILDDVWLDRAPALRAVIRAGNGTDNMPKASLSARKILFTNLPEATTISVAELGIGAIISCLRQFFPAWQSLRDGHWQKDRLLGHELYGKTVGLVGYGRIGQALAQRLAAFGVNILVAGRQQSSAEHQQNTGQAPAQPSRVTLDQLCRQSDIISLQFPLTDETRQLFNHQRLGLMKQGSYLINLARYEVIDMSALQGALQRGQLAAAFIDPGAPGQLDYADFDGLALYALPHLGGSTVEAQDRIGVMIAHTLQQWGLVDGE